MQDFLPSNKSAIVVTDFKSVDDLVSLLLHLNASDSAYEEYLQFKRPGGVTNPLLRTTMKQRKWAINNDWLLPNFITSYECFLCEQLHEDAKVRKQGGKVWHRANVSHYGCPRPQRFSDNPEGNLQLVDDAWWAHEWIHTSYQAAALKEILDAGVDQVSADELSKRSGLLRYKEENRDW